MKKLFGTDGIRGDSRKYPFDNKTLIIIGKSIAEELLGNPRQILIISDTRESAKRIRKYLAEGIILGGMQAVFGGIMPTAAASFLLKNTNSFRASIVISASHNPYRDNGIKIFASDGFKLKDSVEEKIEKRISLFDSLKNPALNLSPSNKSIVKINPKQDNTLLKLYENFIISTFDGYSLKGKNIIIDCANGASYKCAVSVLKKIGAKVIPLNIKPNGKNINEHCGALYPQKLAQSVKKHGAFCGFAFDGDADRLICVDEKGQIRDGDYFLSAMSIFLKERRLLKNNLLVTTVMANLGLSLAMKKAKIKAIVSKVGDRYVLENMQKFKASLGGEQSGHFIFRDILGTGDGILSAVQLLKAILIKGQKMSEFLNTIVKFPQILINEKVAEKIPVEKLPKSAKLIKKYEKILKDKGRILVRYSGTENLLRVMVEGENQTSTKKIAYEILNSMKKEISKQKQFIIKRQ